MGITTALRSSMQVLGVRGERLGRLKSWNGDELCIETPRGTLRVPMTWLCSVSDVCRLDRTIAEVSSSTFGARERAREESRASVLLDGGHTRSRVSDRKPTSMTNQPKNASPKKTSTPKAEPNGQRGQKAGQRVGGGDDRGARAPEKNLPEESGARKHAR